MGIYKSVPELWLKKQSLKKQYDVMSFLQRLRFWEHRREPYIGDLTVPTRHGMARHLDYMAKQSYIVCLGSHSFGQIADVESVTNSHYDFLGPYMGSTEKAKEAILYSYDDKFFNGFAAVFDENVASNIAKHPNVISVFLSRKYKLHTTHSWVFLGLAGKTGKVPKASLWQKSFGEDIIIGSIDSGVWPESKSFSDEGMGPVPAKWKGICQTDKNNSDDFHCNRKLIGARYFYQDFKSFGGKGSFASARDFDGHGTHTLSTAGGNFVNEASVFGLGKGTASGVLPKARVATYKVSWPLESGDLDCHDSDILRAFEKAISDGVDVISIPIGDDIPKEFIYSASCLGSFKAVANGIVVVKSGGNDGPSPNTVTNLEPWVITVAASTTDREFFSYVTLGNKKVLKGTSFHKSGLTPGKFYPLARGADVKARHASAENAMFCESGAIDEKKAKGKILFCLLGGDIKEYDKGVEAARAGAVGLILAGDGDLEVTECPDDVHVLPASHVNRKDASHILNYIKHNRSPTAHISRVETQLGIKPAPYVASFSSRGPNRLDPAILKPDITAPGVNIIAAACGGAYPFIKMSGTSMACAHVAGVVGLLKSKHPEWSSAAIRSALMTTASTEDNYGGPMLESDCSELKSATPFACGAGFIQPNRAVDPGLVYDLEICDYLDYLWHRGYETFYLELFYRGPYTPSKSFNIANFNYPSIVVPNLDLGRSVTVSRRLTNVGSPSEYRVKIQAHPDLKVVVKPQILTFTKKGQKKEFKVTFTWKPKPKTKAKAKTKPEHVFGKLTWSDGEHDVNTPITVRYPH